MACGQNFGKIDFGYGYRPEPRLRVAGSRMGNGSSLPDDPGNSARGISLSLKSVNLQSLAVVELPLLALLFLVFSISALVNPDFELRASGVSVPLLYACPFFALTGIPCLFCGMTRSFLAMGGLDVGQSLSFHPLGPSLFILLAVLALAVAASVVARKRIHLSIGQTLRRRLVSGGAVLLLVAWLFKVIIWRQTGLI